jgi:alpha-tubulin suppressor-like RCC1 family protein
MQAKYLVTAQFADKKEHQFYYEKRIAKKARIFINNDFGNVGTVTKCVANDNTVENTILISSIAIVYNYVPTVYTPYNNSKSVMTFESKRLSDLVKQGKFIKHLHAYIKPVDSYKSEDIYTKTPINSGDIIKVGRKSELYKVHFSTPDVSFLYENSKLSKITVVEKSTENQSLRFSLAGKLKYFDVSKLEEFLKDNNCDFYEDLQGYVDYYVCDGKPYENIHLVQEQKTSKICNELELIEIIKEHSKVKGAKYKPFNLRNYNVYLTDDLKRYTVKEITKHLKKHKLTIQKKITYSTDFIVSSSSNVKELNLFRYKTISVINEDELDEKIAENTRISDESIQADIEENKVVKEQNDKKELPITKEIDRNPEVVNEIMKTPDSSNQSASINDSSVEYLKPNSINDSGNKNVLSNLSRNFLNIDFLYQSKFKSDFISVTNVKNIFVWPKGSCFLLNNKSEFFDRIPINYTHYFNLDEGEYFTKVNLHYTGLVVTNLNRVFYWVGLSSNIEYKKIYGFPVDLTRFLHLRLGEKIQDCNGGVNCNISTSENRVFVWGINDRGELGIGHKEMQCRPYEITKSFSFEIDESIKKIVSNTYLSILLTSKGRIFVWGDNYNNHFRKYITLKTKRPIELKNFVNLALDEIINDIKYDDLNEYYYFFTNHARVIKHKKSSPIDISSKLDLISNEEIVYTHFGYKFIIFVTSSNRVLTSGDNNSGLLGVGSKLDLKDVYDISDRLMLSEDEEIKTIQTKFSKVFMITSKGRLFVWGDLQGFLFGDELNYHNWFYPQEINKYLSLADGDSISECVSEGDFAIILSKMGRIFEMGRSGYFYRSNNKKDVTSWITDITSKIVETGAKLPIKSVFGYRNNVYVLDNDGSLFDWGSNYHDGALADGSYIRRDNILNLHKYYTQLYNDEKKAVDNQEGLDVEAFNNEDINRQIIVGLKGKYGNKLKYCYCDFNVKLGDKVYTSTDSNYHKSEVVEIRHCSTRIRPLPVVTSVVESKDSLFKLDYSNGNISIEKCLHNVEFIEVPETFNGQPVTKILKNAFKDLKSLVSIKLPTSIIEIEDEAFAGCTSLNSFHLDKNPVAFGTDVFIGCESLEEVSVNNSLNYHSLKMRFSGLKSLKKASIKGGYYEVPDELFMDCTSLQEVKLEGEFKSISRSCFENCTSLKRIEFPKSVKEIKQYAFRNCQSLENINLNDFYIYIHKSAFIKTPVLKSNYSLSRKFSNDFDKAIEALKLNNLDDFKQIVNSMKDINTRCNHDKNYLGATLLSIVIDSKHTNFFNVLMDLGAEFNMSHLGYYQEKLSLSNCIEASDFLLGINSFDMTKEIIESGYNICNEDPNNQVAILSACFDTVPETFIKRVDYCINHGLKLEFNNLTKNFSGFEGIINKIIRNNTYESLDYLKRIYPKIDEMKIGIPRNANVETLKRIHSYGICFNEYNPSLNENKKFDYLLSINTVPNEWDLNQVWRQFDTYKILKLLQSGYYDVYPKNTLESRISVFIELKQNSQIVHEWQEIVNIISDQTDSIDQNIEIISNVLLSKKIRTEHLVKLLHSLYYEHSYLFDFKRRFLGNTESEIEFVDKFRELLKWYLQTCKHDNISLKFEDVLDEYNLRYDLPNTDDIWELLLNNGISVEIDLDTLKKSFKKQYGDRIYYLDLLSYIVDISKQNIMDLINEKKAILLYDEFFKEMLSTDNDYTNVLLWIYNRFPNVKQELAIKTDIKALSEAGKVSKSLIDISINAGKRIDSDSMFTILPKYLDENDIDAAKQTFTRDIVKKENYIRLFDLVNNQPSNEVTNYIKKIVLSIFPNAEKDCLDIELKTINKETEKLSNNYQFVVRVKFDHGRSYKYNSKYIVNIGDQVRVSGRVDSIGVVKSYEEGWIDQPYMQEIIEVL